MKCWNCLKEIPDGAASCSYCEKKQDHQSPDPEAFRKSLEAVDADVPGLMQMLGAMTGDFATAEEFANAMMSGGCPACGSDHTEDCEVVRGIENILVGRCMACATLYCTGCGQAFKNEVVTVASSKCPACGSGDTDYPSEDSENGFEELQEIVTCHACGAEYCAACGNLG